MTPALPSFSFLDPCSLPLVHNLCGAVGGAAKAVAGDVLSTIAKAFVDAAGNLLKLTLSLWTKVDVPQFDEHSGPVGLLRDHTAWLTALLAVATLLILCAKMALTRHHAPGVDAARGLLTMLVATAVAVPLVMLASGIGDGFSQWILDRAAGGGFPARLDAITAGLAVIAPAIVIMIVPLLILTSVAQVALMIVRVAVLVVLTGAAVPAAAAVSGTGTGRHAHQRVWTWLAAFVAYKPVAAIIYASAFWLVGEGKDVVSVVSGLTLMVLAVLALPALLRLIAPIAAAASHAGGGAALAGTAALAATGARIVAASRTSAAAPPDGAGRSGPAGASGAAGVGRTAPAGAPGPTGGGGPAGAAGASAGAATGGSGAGGAWGAAGASGAAGAAGAAGVAAEVGTAAKDAARASVPAGGNGVREGS